MLHHCDVKAWTQYCLQHPDAAPELRFPKPVVADDGSIPERKFGKSCTSKWQEEIEAMSFPNGMPDDVDIVGVVHLFDVSDLQPDGSRKSANMYSVPAGVCKEVRCMPSPPISTVELTRVCNTAIVD